MAHRFIRAAALAFLLAAFSASPSIASAQNPRQAKGLSNKAYIVQLSEEPVVAYRGGIPGFRATRPSKGQKIDPTSAHVINYASFLASRHDAALSAVGGGKKLYSYRFAFNGFAAELTEEQVAEMLQVPGVVAVNKDEARALDTSSTPAFLGLTRPGRPLGPARRRRQRRRERHHRHRRRRHLAREPELLGSHRDRTATPPRTASSAYQQIPGWHGRCVPGDAFNASNCNQKLIGAQYFNAGWGGDAGIDAQLPWEFDSPRDFGGHGTHTASTAGGNNDVPTTGGSRGVRRHQRHRPARPHRGLQGLLADRDGRQLLHLRQRGGDRPGRRRRRGRDQLLDQRLHDQLPRPGRDRLPLRRRCGRVRRGLGRQQRPDHEHRCAPRPVAHHGRGRYPQPQRRKAR